MNLPSKLTILTYWNCCLLRLKLYANLIKAKDFSFLNLINFIVNTSKITQIDQHLHSYNSMIIYIDGLRQLGLVLQTKFIGNLSRSISISVLLSKKKLYENITCQLKIQLFIQLLRRVCRVCPATMKPNIICSSLF